MAPRGIGPVLTAFGVLLLGLWGLLAVTGVPVGQAGGVSVLISVGSLGGGVLWGMIRGRRIDLLEIVGMGAAIFTVAYALIRVISAGAEAHPPIWLILIVVAGGPIAWWLAASTRGRATFTPTLHRLAVASAIGVILLFTLLNTHQFQRYGLGPDASLAGYLPDLYLFESMGHALANFGPGEGGLMAGWPVRYHWLSYALGGSLTGDVGLWPFVSLTRVVPLLSAVILACLGASWARRLASYRWTPVLAVLLLLIGTSIGPTANRVINWDSPSQSLTSVWLLALLLAATSFARGRIRWSILAVITLLAVGVSAGKTSEAAIALGALGFAALAALVRKNPIARRLVPLLLVASTAVAITYLLTSSGQAGGGFLEPSPMMRALTGRTGSDGQLFGAAMLALGLLLAVLPRWIGLLPLGIYPQARRGVALEYALALGAAVTASLAILLISSTDTNQSWFLDAACVPLALVSAVGVDRAWRYTRAERPSRVAVNTLMVALAALMSVASVQWTRRTYDSGAYPLGIPLSVVTLLVWLAGAVVICAAVAWVVARRRNYAVGRLFVASLASLLTFASIGYGIASADVPGTVVSTYAVSGPDGIKVDELAPSLEWIDAHASVDDVVATDFDSNSLSSALSERLPYAEWQKYASTHTPVGAAAEYDARLAAVRAIVSGAADLRTSSVCEAGVDWLIVRSDTPLPTDLDALAARTDEWFTILRLPC